MKVSLNTIKQYVDFDLPPVDELVSRINQQLGGVEEIIDLGAKYHDAVIVRIVTCAPLEGTDHLNVTKIDDGGVTKDVERDEDGRVQVVCGAPNVRVGMLAVWLPPGATVPSTAEDDEPFVLSAKPLRGVVSNGMLASPRELALGDDHDGILEVSPEEVTSGSVAIVPGANFAQTFGLDDTIIDIENKMFTHRPDCFGQLGVAREIAGILGQSFTTPSRYVDDPQFENGDGLELEVVNDIPDKVQRFMAVTVKDVTVKPSPLWLRCELVRLGGKPINNIVDVTNYVMLQTAQPVHAYDYDKVGTSRLGVRLAKKGETVALLNGKVEALNDTDIVITDGEKPIGLGGVMGGRETEVSNQTKNIILECAHFDMYTIRRTSMHHGLFTDAVTRFTKGQSPLQNDRVLLELMKSVMTVAGGEPSSKVIDEQSLQTFSERTVHAPLSVSDNFINQRLGLRLTDKEIATLLSNVEITHDDLNYIAPYWRTDIEIAEDIVEEVGRLYGFDKLPQDLPRRTVIPAIVKPERALKDKLRAILSRAGANEVLTYSFVHRNLLEKAGQDPRHAFQLSNALSPDLHYYRMTVLPSLLDKVHMNVRAGYEHFALFEIGKTHSFDEDGDNFVDEDGVPLEGQLLSLALANGDFYQAKAITHFMASSLGIEFTYEPLNEHVLFEPKRSALVRVDGEPIGVVGEFRASARRAFKLPDVSAGFEFNFDTLLAMVSDTQSSYTPLSKFPSAERDVTLQVDRGLSYAETEKAITDHVAKLDVKVTLMPLGIYQPEQGSTKNMTFRLQFTSAKKTLSGDEVTAIMNDFASDMNTKLKATII